MNFTDRYNTFDWDTIRADIQAKTEADVEKVLKSGHRPSLEDFKALVSPAADRYLDRMADLSHHLTQKRFGKTVQMYVPLYLSNECSNGCQYCGFSRRNQIRRVTLTDDQILSEVATIKKMGFDHVLLVTGESRSTGLPYLKNAIRLVRPYFSNISAEVAPLDLDDYRQLIEEGLYAVYVYQETYGPLYAQYHPQGRKKDFAFRLTTPDRLGAAGIHKIGLGCLLGLDDWRTDSWFLAAHLAHLEKQFWQTKFCISFPRLRVAAGYPDPPVVISDRELVQLICAYRIFNENVELSISTRERQAFRDHIFQLGITSMSAGSKTNPGGYSLWQDNLDQFQIEDQRPPDQVVKAIKSKGFCPVWKDWYVDTNSHLS